MKKLIFLLIAVQFFTVAQSQNKSIYRDSIQKIDAELAIRNIEQLSEHNEIVFGMEESLEVKIDYDKISKRLICKRVKTLANEISEMTFVLYLDDLDENSMTFSMTKTIEESFFLWIEINSKSKSINQKLLDYKKGNKNDVLNITDSKKLNRFWFSLDNPVSEYEGQKLIQSWISLLDVERATEKIN